MPHSNRPRSRGRTATYAVQTSLSTLIGRLALSRSSQQNGDSGVVPLLDGPDAFTARIALIRAAEIGVDVQYYIWQRDATGLILLDELRKAAERGVRIRFLLDDNSISGLDDDLAALDALPEVEVRLFNPFVLRRLKPLGYAFDFFRLNRRMHNKSLTVDGGVSIFGGRNIGNVYFGFGSGLQFIDTDVIVTGQVATDIGTDFDRYWHSRSSHPIARLVAGKRQRSLDRLMSDAKQAAGSREGRIYAEQLRSSKLVGQIVSGRLTFEWTKIVLVSDDPAKGLGKAKKRDLLFPQLMAMLATPLRSVELVSAYFVPGRIFTARLAQLARAGARVRILTNSQSATDVVVVHSAYVKYRPQLLQFGVALYELKPTHAARGESSVGLAGSSRASLHSKTLAVDEARIFVGSFNFDPRSLLFNTEMGVLIDSPHMARAVTATFSHTLPRVSHVPKLTRDGAMVWGDIAADGSHVLHQTEPGTNSLSRLLLRLIGLLPIERLL